MMRLSLWLSELWHADEGQDTVEYTLLLAFIVLSSAALYFSGSDSIRAIWSGTNSTLLEAQSAASS